MNGMVRLQPVAPAAAAMLFPEGACSRCAHGQSLADGLHCHCPEVMGRGQPVPVALARQRGGACGVEAWHHDYRRPAR